MSAVGIEVNQHLLASGRRASVTLACNFEQYMKALVVGAEDLREHLNPVSGVQFPEIGEVRLDHAVTAAS
ncbi:hypothetical protein QCM80_40830 [Bradyrhizobium sp. SSUT112]|nr:hypothetical protein [Bradyrhizobium sp. SSUT112]